VDIVAAVGADEEPPAVVQPGEGAFDDPPVAAEAGAVLGLAASDDRFDAPLPDEARVLVVVVAAVSEQRPWSSSRPPDSPANRRDAVEQFDQSGHVVAVAAGERPGERDAAAVYEDDGACCPIGRDRPGWDPFLSPLFRLQVTRLDDRSLVDDLCLHLRRSGFIVESVAGGMIEVSTGALDASLERRAILTHLAVWRVANAEANAQPAD
jgi:hypothetical protein